MFLLPIFLWMFLQRLRERREASIGSRVGMNWLPNEPASPRCDPDEMALRLIISNRKTANLSATVPRP
jgi:hypothetical protein